MSVEDEAEERLDPTVLIVDVGGCFRPVVTGGGALPGATAATPWSLSRPQTQGTNCYGFEMMK